MRSLSAWTEPLTYAASLPVLQPDWLQAWRAQQHQEFLQRGFPQPREEQWKYTSLASLLEQNFSLPTSVTIPEEISLEHLADAYRIVFIDGVFSPVHSILEDLPEKIILTHQQAAIMHYPDLYQAANQLATAAELSVFHWLNGAFMSDGLFLIVPDHVELAKPIHLQYFTTQAHALMHHPRHLLQLGANSRVSLLEEYSGLSNAAYFNNVVTKITVGTNAQLDYYKLQREALAAVHIANTCIEQWQDSQVRAYHFALGSRLNREDINFTLQENGANCLLSGFYYPQAHQHIDLHTRIDHRSSQSHSQQYYKGMIAAQSRAVFNGKIIAHPQAQQVTAHQENHNLLLAESAEINTKPELEVFSDNIQCTHGATVGHLDAQALFYLRSRGIPDSLARSLLMMGFVNEILQQLPDATIAKYMQNDTFTHEELSC